MILSVEQPLASKYYICAHFRAVNVLKEATKVYKLCI